MINARRKAEVNFMHSLIITIKMCSEKKGLERKRIITGYDSKNICDFFSLFQKFSAI